VEPGTSKAVRSAFANIKANYDLQRNSDGLICKNGFYKESFVLKLQKASWTNDSMDRLPNESGLFFSIWINQDSATRVRANYNIHALKLRQLKGYSITSREFAEAFREGFKAKRGDWPNVSVDYGPQTLMQGWTEFDPARSERDALLLVSALNT
jgi:hypothetical protein